MAQYQRVLAFGATSAICTATLRRFLQAGSAYYLVARNEQKLQLLTQDLTTRGASVEAESIDFNSIADIRTVLTRAKEFLQTIDVILIAHGTLNPQEELEQSLALCADSINANFSSPALIIMAAAEILDEQDSGTLAVFSSVAGDRGRRSNYLYGASKSGINTLLEGLRGRFSTRPINIVTIKPGMIDTPMTSTFKKGALWSTPDLVANDCFKAVTQNKHLIYTPFYWRYIMWVIRLIPTGLLARLGI